MTYEQAKKIQSIVFDLNLMDGKTTYCCAVEPAYTEISYCCYLYSERDSLVEYLALSTLALSLEQMIDFICSIPDRTSIKIHDKEFLSIRLW